MKDLTTTAAALYDGGWRSGDKELLMEEYQFEKGLAEDICRELARYEKKEER